MLLIALAGVCSPGAARAQDGFEEVVIEPIPVRDGIHMLVGQGGNLGLLVGEDGAFLIDDQFAPLTPKILTAIGRLTDRPVRFVINTHWHPDHTGGNENIGEAGAVIVAHENVRKRLSTEQFIAAFGRKVAPLPDGALPQITFADGVTFHWNGQTVQVFHVDHAHTDGDAVVQFSEANVIHTGDVFFNGIYPLIDVSSGGSLDGMIAAARLILARCDDATKLIPGHGPLGEKADLERYVAMLETVRDRLRPLIAAGKTAEEAVAAKPTADFDPRWGGGFLKPDVWVRIVYGAAGGKR